MAEVLQSYSTIIMVDVLLDGTHRSATRDFYDGNDAYYRGTLLDFPAINMELSDIYYGVEQGSTVTLRFANEGNLGADRGPYVFESPQNLSIDYTETDPNGRIVAAADSITFTGITEDEDAWVYRDMGAGHFFGNFKIHFEVEITASTVTTEVGTLILANSVKSYEDIDSDGESYLGVVLFRDAGGNYEIWLDEVDSGARHSDHYTGAVGTRYYLVMERKEEVGTYGTLYCYIYSDADHVNLLDTLSVALHSSRKDFRYVYGLNAHNAGDAADAMSGVVANVYLYRERTWDDLANVQELRERWVRIQRHDPTDIGNLLAENEDDLTTESGIYFLVYAFEQELEFRGKIIDYRIGDTVELVIESRDDWILDTLLPLHVVTTDLFTATAIDLGEPVNICFGHCRNVPLRNIQNSTGTDQYDYLIGYGTIESLWVDHANGIGVKRDGVLVDTTEYTFYDGSQGSPYPGYAFIRFTTEQMDFSGSFHKLTADVYGLELSVASAERNFATVVKHILWNSVWGLDDNVHHASFVAAAAALDGIGNMYCDGAITEQKQVRDFLDGLLFPARASIERNTSGDWEMDVDVASASVLSLGDNDGYYNNAEIGDLSITPSDQALKTAIVQYSLNLLDEDAPFKESSVSVHTFGVERTYSLPFVLEDDTAELVLSYLKNRSLYSDRRVPVFVGMEGRDLSRGDVVTLTKASRLLSSVTFKVERITKGGIGFELECREYSGSIYKDEVVTPPTAPTVSDITIEGPRSIVGDSQLGDGINKSGTITLNLAPGQGDCYIAARSAGATFDFLNWQVDGGFILGIDDSDSDIAKFFIGDSGGHSLSWNGTVLAVTGTLTATAGAIGGWTIDATSIYTGTEDHAGYTTNAGDITIYSDGINASIHAKNFYIDASGNLACQGGNIGGFYIGANDIWGGNAAIGNAATTIVLGNLDGTSKIALGASADAITIAGVQSGFIVDGGGNMRVGDTNSFLKWSAGALSIQLASGEAMTLSAGGDIVLAPNDANPSIIEWDSVVYLGSRTAGRLCIWSDAGGSRQFSLGWDSINNVQKLLHTIDFRAKYQVWSRAYFDANNYAEVDVRAASGTAYIDFLTADAGNVRTIRYIDASWFGPLVNNVIDLAQNGAAWKDGWFSGTVTANKFTDLGGGYDFFMPNPANPEKEMLRHWGIETDGLRTLYVGRGKTNRRRKAIIKMPQWFTALNDIETCEYHLTSISGLCKLTISKQINRKGQFEVFSDIPDQEFSWQVVVMRGDPIGKESIRKYPIIEIRKGG